jgi:hypothetical protein
VENHYVRLTAQDTFQQFHKSLLGLSTWLEWVADDTSDTAKPQTIQLDDVAVEKRHAARGGYAALIMGSPLVFVLVMIPQDAGHPARRAAESRPNRADLSEPPASRAARLRPEIAGQHDTQPVGGRQVATVAQTPKMFCCNFAKQTAAFTRPPGAISPLSLGGRQEFPPL